jgi:hypothetical protein
LTILAAPATAPAASTHIIVITQAACAEGVCALIELNHELHSTEDKTRKDSVMTLLQYVMK